MFKLGLIWLLVISKLISQSVPEKIELLGVIGDKEDNILLNVVDLCIDHRGFLFVSDKAHNKIKVFDKNLDMIYSFGEKGRQGGTFKSTGQIDAGKNYIVISDFLSSRFQVFDQNLNFNDVFYAEGPITGVTIINDNKILLGIYNNFKHRNLYLYSTDGNLEKVFGTLNFQNDMFKDVFILTQTKSGKIVLAYFILNIVEVIDLNKNDHYDFELSKIPAEPEYIKDSQLNAPKDNLLSSIASDSYNNLYFLLDEYTEFKKREVLVYNIEGNYLSSLILPDKSNEIYIDSENNLYVVTNNRTIIQKFKIIYE